MPGDNSPGGGAIARAAAPAAANQGSGSRGLPAGVTVETYGQDKYYIFSVGGKSVEFKIEHEGSRRGSVSFEVAGDYDRGALRGRDADRAALTIARIFKHDVSTRPNGFKYEASAFMGDGYGDKRAASYERAGFSRPEGRNAGGLQFGVVKGGKLVPDNATLKEWDSAY